MCVPNINETKTLSEIGSLANKYVYSTTTMADSGCVYQTNPSSQPPAEALITQERAVQPMSMAFRHMGKR